MTTNHPEKLDPALVRPGRINKKMLLGYLYLPEAEKMVEHYFGKMTDRQRDRMDQLFTPNVFTPAQVSAPSARFGHGAVHAATQHAASGLHPASMSRLADRPPPRMAIAPFALHSGGAVVRRIRHCGRLSARPQDAPPARVLIMHKANPSRR